MPSSIPVDDDIIYDAVIVGSGVSGSIVANELSKHGFHVLVLEAGPGEDQTIRGYENYLSRFYESTSKDNNSPYPANPNAAMPRSPAVHALVPAQPDDSSYLVQNGPFPLDSTYTRTLGGTTMHWEGKALRMLPEDFETRSRYGQGLDWPISYEELAPHYALAERKLGVSADVHDQAELGIPFEPGYVFPMQGLPASYLDQQVAAGIDGTDVRVDGEEYRLKVRPFPQARNGIPNAAYDGGAGYVPVGAVSTHQVEQGERCQGNNNCVPLCPVQAKYHAGKTLAKALASTTGRVELRTQAVASRVDVDPVHGRVSHLEYKAYQDPGSPEHTTQTVRARLFVLAANAVETPRLMLASGLPSSSGLMGRNLMDHAYLLTWGLMPQPVGTMRGTVCTSGISDLRGGAFRHGQAAFAADIHNDGWGWAGGTPEAQVLDLVDNMNAFGADLRQGAIDRVSRQLLLAWMVELMPDPSNRITVDGRYKDALGNLKPVLSYNIADYTMAGVAQARGLSRRIFQRLGVEDHTQYRPTDVGYVSYQGEGYVIKGGNHWSGTHVMGTTPANSVVDADQRSWDHENLYLVGSGSMPSIGTSNTTLTLAALCLKSAEQMVRRLRNETAAVERNDPGGRTGMTLSTITTKAGLQEYLHAAMQLEHATIPPYLTALYSIHPGTNSDAFHVIRVVAVEEMLHLTLAANLLNAVGGEPDLTRAGFVPRYPVYLPDGETDFQVSLEAFSPTAIGTFLKIERPAQAPSAETRVLRRPKPAKAIPDVDPSGDDGLHFWSIGEFYAEIARGIQHLHDAGVDLFTGDPSRQVTPDLYYSGGGEVIPVKDLSSALAAIELISEQGEGLTGSIYDEEGELSHYYRFQQLSLGRYYQAGDVANAPTGPALEVDWDAVYPILTNASVTDFPVGSEVREAAEEFNAGYAEFLDLVNQAFTGRPDLLIPAVGGMFALRDQVGRLVRNPIPGRQGVNAAPTFEMPESVR